jgi:hypothetical protein
MMTLSRPRGLLRGLLLQLSPPFRSILCVTPGRATTTA